MEVREIVRVMKEPYLIDKHEAIQIMCEMIEVFNEYSFTDYYKIVINGLTYDSFIGILQEKLNMKEWDDRAWNCGLDILIEGEVWYLFNRYWNDAEYLRNIYGEDSSNDIECMKKLRRIFKRYDLVWDRLNYGYLISFRKSGDKI